MGAEGQSSRQISMTDIERAGSDPPPKRYPPPRPGTAFDVNVARGEADDEGGCGACLTALITFLSVVLIVLTFPISVFLVVKQVQVRGES